MVGKLGSCDMADSVCTAASRREARTMAERRNAFTRALAVSSILPAPRHPCLLRMKPTPLFPSAPYRKRFGSCSDSNEFAFAFQKELKLALKLTHSWLKAGEKQKAAALRPTGSADVARVKFDIPSRMRWGQNLALSRAGDRLVIARRRTRKQHVHAPGSRPRHVFATCWF